MIIQNEPIAAGEPADMSFTVPSDDLRLAMESLAPLESEFGLRGIVADEEVGKVSVIGAGMRSHPGVAAKVFTVLASTASTSR